MKKKLKADNDVASFIAPVTEFWACPLTAYCMATSLLTSPTLAHCPHLAAMVTTTTVMVTTTTVMVCPPTPHVFLKPHLHPWQLSPFPNLVVFHNTHSNVADIICAEIFEPNLSNSIPVSLYIFVCFCALLTFWHSPEPLDCVPCAFPWHCLQLLCSITLILIVSNCPVSSCYIMICDIASHVPSACSFLLLSSFFCASLSGFIPIFVRPSSSSSVHPHLHLSVPIFVRPSPSLSVCPHLCPSIPIFVRLSPSLSVHPHLCPAGPTGPYRPLSHSLHGLSYALFL